LQRPLASQGIPKGGFVSAEETQAKVLKVQVQATVQVLQAVHLYALYRLESYDEARTL
jgi:hypothetical protein